MKKINVNNQQLKILLAHKDKQFQLKKEIHSDLFPPLVEALKQIRELTQNIAVIAGAIAAFTIPVIDTPVIQIKLLAHTSLFLLFSTISYAVYHLTEVIPKEVNELAKQHSTYMSLLDNEINRVNTIIESGNINKLIHTDEEAAEIIEKMQQLKIIPRPDKSLDILRLLLISSLFILTLSFIPINIYQNIFNFFLSN